MMDPLPLPSSTARSIAWGGGQEEEEEEEEEEGSAAYYRGLVMVVRVQCAVIN